MPIPFKVYCEWATCKQYWPSFIMDSDHLPHLTSDELALVKIEPKDYLRVKVWYPASGYVLDPLVKEGFIESLKIAIEDGDMDLVVKLRKQMKELGI